MNKKNRIQLIKRLDHVANSILNAGTLVYNVSILELEEIRKQINKNEHPDIQARSLHLQGRIYSRMGRYEEGLHSLSRGLEICDPFPDIHSQILDSLARLFSETNCITLAELYYNKSLDLKNKIGDKLGEAVSLQGLALHYEQLGESKKFVKFLKKSLACHRQIDNKSGISNILSRLASALLITEDFGKIAKILEESAEITSQGSPSHVHNLGIEAVLNWRYYLKKEKAILLFQAAIKQFRKSKDHYGIGIIQLRWGRCHREDDDRKEAAKHFKQALSCFEKSGNRGSSAEAILALDTVNGRTPRTKRIERLKSALRMAYAEGAVPCQKDLEDRLRHLSEAQYLQLMVESSSPGMAILGSRYLDGNREEATILFADVAGFCAYSENRDPHEVFRLLNGMYESIQRAFDETDGIVDCHMGDGVMVIFLGESGGDHADRAGEAGRRVQKYISEFNSMIEKGAHPPMRLRVGINTGELFIGRIGAKNRWTFSAIGAATNLAARLESEAQPGTVLMSDVTYNKIQDRSGLMPDENRKIKGFDDPVKTYVWRSG